MFQVLTRLFSPHSQHNLSSTRHMWRAVEAPVQIKAILDHKSEFHQIDLNATVLNLCEDGAFIHLAQELDATYLFACFGEDQERAMRCRVVHQSSKNSQETLIGLEFEEMVECQVFEAV